VIARKAPGHQRGPERRRLGGPQRRERAQPARQTREYRGARRLRRHVAHAEAVDPDDEDPARRLCRVEPHRHRLAQRRGLRPQGERQRDRRSRREDGQDTREWAIALRVEPQIQADRDEHRGGCAHHHGRKRQGPQRLDRQRVAVGEQVGRVEPGQERERHEREHAQEGTLGDHRAARAPPAQRAPGGGQQSERQRSDGRPGQEQARGERHGLVAQSQRGVQIQGECGERGGADRGHEGRTQEHPAGHGTQAYPNQRTRSTRGAAPR
jgi:hypothetical protein